MQALLNFLKTNTFEALTENFGILVKNYNDELYNLSYTNHASPKYHEIVDSCRGIVIDKDLNVLARPFDRFYNYGENPNQEPFDFSETHIFDKIDGSFIKFWWYPKEQRWCVGTRGTAFCEMQNKYDTNFKGLVYKAMNVDNDELFSGLCDLALDRDQIHMFEITSPFNRVIINHTKTKLYYLNSRDNKTGEYSMLDEGHLELLGVEAAKKYAFKSVNEMLELNDSITLDTIHEGFIVCDKNLKPIMKMKCDLYVSMHYLRGEGLTHRRIIYMIIRNEYDEYLTYFPDDRVHFEKYFATWNHMIDDLNKLCDLHEGKTPREVSEVMAKDFRSSVVVGVLKYTSNDLIAYLDTTLEMFRYKVFMNYYKQLGYDD